MELAHPANGIFNGKFQFLMASIFGEQVNIFLLSRTVTLSINVNCRTFLFSRAKFTFINERNKVGNAYQE